MDRVYVGDSGDYWCESEGERSNKVHVTVTGTFAVLVLSSPSTGPLTFNSVNGFNTFNFN